MTQEPAREVDISAMDEGRATALAQVIRNAGYSATIARVTWGSFAGDENAPWYVSAETNMGWQSFFTEIDWDHDPSNPQRTEPPNW